MNKKIYTTRVGSIPTGSPTYWREGNIVQFYMIQSKQDGKLLR